MWVLCTEHGTHWQITSQVKTLFSIKKRKKKKENTNAKTLPRNAIQMLLNLHTLVLCIITFFFFFFWGKCIITYIKKKVFYILKCFVFWVTESIWGVWFVILNNHFRFLNNISRISTHFFTHTYFHKYFQTTISVFEHMYQTGP